MAWTNNLVIFVVILAVLFHSHECSKKKSKGGVVRSSPTPSPRPTPRPSPRPSPPYTPHTASPSSHHSSPSTHHHSHKKPSPSPLYGQNGHGSSYGAPPRHGVDLKDPHRSSVNRSDHVSKQKVTNSPPTYDHDHSGYQGPTQFGLHQEQPHHDLHQNRHQDHHMGHTPHYQPQQIYNTPPPTNPNTHGGTHYTAENSSLPLPRGVITNQSTPPTHGNLNSPSYGSNDQNSHGTTHNTPPYTHTYTHRIPTPPPYGLKDPHGSSVGRPPNPPPYTHTGSNTILTYHPDHVSEQKVTYPASYQQQLQNQLPSVSTSRHPPSRPVDHPPTHVHSGYQDLNHLPRPQYSYPGYFYTPTYYHYSSFDTGNTALGLYLGYRLGSLQTPTYNHYSFYDGSTPRYDHYTVHHYYHNRDTTPQYQEVRSNNIMGCVGDSRYICPENTTSLCTNSGTLMCVVNLARTAPCAENRTLNCVSSTISCRNNTAPECKKATTNTTVIHIPCVSTTKVYGDIKFENNTIVADVTTTTTEAPTTTTSTTTTQVPTNVPNMNYFTDYPNAIISTKYPITTTPEPMTTIPAATRARKWRVPQEFCVTVFAEPAKKLAEPAKKPITEGEKVFDTTKEIVTTFLARAWGL